MSEPALSRRTAVGCTVVFVLLPLFSGCDHTPQTRSRSESLSDSLAVVAVDTLVARAKRASGGSDTGDVFDRQIMGHLKADRGAIRRELLSRPFVWSTSTYLHYWWLDGLLFLLAGAGTGILMTRYTRLRRDWVARDTTVGGPSGFRDLVARDFAPVAFEVHAHSRKLEPSPYRGFVHWLRDAIEKMLSLGVLVIFTAYLARLGQYALLYVFGQGWRLVYLPHDINVALAVAGWILIIDGFIHIAAMIDAPGVSRTLDSLIVVLAGFVVMLVQASPGEHTLVSFGVGDPEWLAPMLAVVIGLLFCVRIHVAYWRVKTEEAQRNIPGDGNLAGPPPPPIAAADGA